MEENRYQSSISQEEQEIDLIELAQKVWKKRILLLKICSMGLVIGLIVAFSIPKEYTTTVQLAPEITEGTSKMGNLGGLAAMAGVNLNTSGGDAISPDLYPDVVKSVPFILELFPTLVYNQKIGDKISLYEYLEEYQNIAWWSYIIQAPFKLLGWIKELFLSEIEIDPGESSKSNIYYFTKDKEEIYEDLKDRISLSVDKKTFVINLSVQMQDPVISAQMADVVLEQLQEYITTYRTQKAKQDLEFTEVVFEEAKEKYYKAQRAVALFEDANRNIVSSTYRTELQKLQNDMSLAFSVYNALAQQLEQDRLKVQERTPVYTVIEPAKVPLKASSPRKILILIGFLFLAVFLGVGYILFRDPLIDAFKSNKEINS